MSKPRLTEEEKAILVGLLEDVDVDDFSDDEWEALTSLTRKILDL